MAINFYSSDAAHSLAALGMEEKDTYTLIHLYDCNSPGEDFCIKLIGSPGSFKTWEYILKRADGGEMLGNYAGDEMGSGWQIVTITEDLEEGEIIPIRVTSEGDNTVTDSPILCWLEGNENVVSFKSSTKDSGIAVATEQLLISAASTEPMNYQLDVSDNSVQVDGPKGEEFSVSYDVVEDDSVKTIRVTGTLSDTATVIPENDSASVQGAYDVKISETITNFSKNGDAEKQTEEKKSLSKASVSRISSKTYTGKAISQSPLVKLDGKRLKSGTDYTLSYKNNVNAGTRASVTITGKGTYTGSVTRTFMINKAVNPLTIKAKTVTIKYRKLKKKKQTLTANKVIKFIKKGKGKMTYTKVYGKKKITINKKNGKITVKKGLRKGTYKVKVKVKAGGNANYKTSAVKTLTFKIKVK